tara:strand:- start:86 stop:241 length:156 start_codon:yes stop_codon:yes gene_type:complete
MNIINIAIDTLKKMHLARNNAVKMSNTKAIKNLNDIIKTKEKQIQKLKEDK